MLEARKVYSIYGKAIAMDQVICEFREDGITLPLFIKPKNGQDSVEFLIQWIGENKELLKQKILEYGRYPCDW